ncbi:Protein PER1 [Spathaspora sp. JA1]|nr:Protein PER1 [Spathaspora sp. JA1]
MVLTNHLLLLAVATLTIASPGDDLDEFQQCIEQCQYQTCDKSGDIKYYNQDWKFDSMPLAKHLQLLYWDCDSNCDYQCQRIITKERKEKDQEIYQFHGKWPFLRVFGIQELFSVLMSIGNFYVTYLGFKKLWKCYNSKPKKLRVQFNNALLVSIVTMIAWICSSIFHIRDFAITEHLDYYFAGLTILTGFHAVGARFFMLHRPDRVLLKWSFSIGCVSAYMYHVRRLITDWSYTYNMRANIFIGVCQNILYALLCYDLYSKYYTLEQKQQSTDNHLKYINFKQMILSSFYSRSAKLYSLYPLLLCTIVDIGMSLEIFDFPPVIYGMV